MSLRSHGQFQTERLLIEPWDTPMIEDPEALCKELSSILDNDVTAFLPPHLLFQPGETKVEEWAKAFAGGSFDFATSKNKISTIRLSSTDTTALTGLLMLRTVPSSQEDDDISTDMHIGYIFGKDHWGKGLATELLKGLVKHLQQAGYQGTLHAGVAHGNPASSRVLEKAGFSAAPATSSGEEHDVDFFIRSFAGKAD
ncbi:expressed unknown protein [Seminavis robusta]|uniref:N-acetyltransferase domain-containing protein n=1 Tax=Seminavis robusta TaxID=568900 RepID=A0A9N8H2F3_9STRA|nr:expressed unknown protein [Seminavis robusta]|eukprot:Sro35_g022290.1 n/a (198) ;mRNA; f:64358-64951